MTNHQRIQRSILTGIEKPVLIWLAHRMPASINSDHLSALGLLSMLAVGGGFAAARVVAWADLLVVLALAANWFGDSLDGTLARVRGQERPRYGFYVDHVIDLAGTTALFAGLAVSGIMSPMIAAAVLTAYLLVCAESYLGTHAAGMFRMSFLGVGPTELRIVLAVGALFGMRDPWITSGALGPVRLFDVGGVVAAAGMILTFITCAIGQTRALYRAEPLPPRQPAADRTTGAGIVQRAT